MKCLKCKSENVIVVKSGPHKKIVCKDCLAFVKFLTGSEYETWLQIMKEGKEDGKTAD